MRGRPGKSHDLHANCAAEGLGDMRYDDCSNAARNEDLRMLVTCKHYLRLRQHASIATSGHCTQHLRYAQGTPSSAGKFSSSRCDRTELNGASTQDSLPHKQDYPRLLFTCQEDKCSTPNTTPSLSVKVSLARFGCGSTEVMSEPSHWCDACRSNRCGLGLKIRFADRGSSRLGHHHQRYVCRILREAHLGVAAGNVKWCIVAKTYSKHLTVTTSTAYPHTAPTVSQGHNTSMSLRATAEHPIVYHTPTIPPPTTPVNCHLPPANLPHIPEDREKTLQSGPQFISEQDGGVGQNVVLYRGRRVVSVPLCKGTARCVESKMRLEGYYCLHLRTYCINFFLNIMHYNIVQPTSTHRHCYNICQLSMLA
jgi:hypothetical protein